jgi:hypothetical protein
MLLVGLTGGVLVPVAVHADSAKADVCQALQSGSDCNTNGTGSVDVSSLVATIINIMSLIVGVAAVIMLIVAGIRYVTSGGDSNTISEAKNTIIYALVGLVVAGAAQLLVQFVLNKL